jgi:hypothetical protein
MLPRSWFGSRILGTIRPLFLASPPQGEKLGVPRVKKKQVERNEVPYKLAIGKMMTGLPKESFSIMVLPLGSWGYHTPIYMLRSPSGS